MKLTDPTGAAKTYGLKQRFVTHAEGSEVLLRSFCSWLWGSPSRHEPWKPVLSDRARGILKGEPVCF